MTKLQITNKILKGATLQELVQEVGAETILNHFERYVEKNSLQYLLFINDSYLIKFDYDVTDEIVGEKKYNLTTEINENVIEKIKNCDSKFQFIIELQFRKHIVFEKVNEFVDYIDNERFNGYALELKPKIKEKLEERKIDTIERVERLIYNKSGKTRVTESDIPKLIELIVDELLEINLVIGHSKIGDSVPPRVNIKIPIQKIIKLEEKLYLKLDKNLTYESFKYTRYRIDKIFKMLIEDYN